MAEGNGVPIVKIGRKGLKTFQMGDGEPFTIDVVDTYNQLRRLTDAFRDEKGEIPADRREEFDLTCLRFVREVSKTPDVNMTEAFEFNRILHDLTEELSAFFVRKSASEPSSPASTPTLRFST